MGRDLMSNCDHDHDENGDLRKWIKDEEVGLRVCDSWKSPAPIDPLNDMMIICVLNGGEVMKEVELIPFNMTIVMMRFLVAH